jgi:hypothetical protein
VQNLGKTLNWCEVDLKSIFSKIAFVFIGLIASESSYALPSFSEQTDQPCKLCHLNVGELTPSGRQFKLKGYTQGKRVSPFSITATASVTKVKSTASSADASITMPKNGKLIPEEANLYTAGKLSDHLGGNVKWTSSFANTTPTFGSSGVQTGTHTGHDFFLDASDVRFAKEDVIASQNVIWGVTVNNAPGAQDLWNTTPVHAFPYRSSSLLNAWGIGQFGPTSMIDGGLLSQTMGVGSYAMVNDEIYVELSNYIKVSPSSSALQLSGPINTINSNSNPYWRLAWNKVNGPDSYMVGTFGMVTNLARDPFVAGSASGRYTDQGLDVQYQHITDAHSVSAQATYIHEQVEWGTRSVGRSHDAPSSRLSTFRTKLTYDYLRTYGSSIFYFRSNGSTDNLYWSYNQDSNVVTGACNQNTSLLAFCSSNGSPKTNGMGFELYYVPTPKVHVALQQTYYRSFLGGGTFIDNSSGGSRDARDNNLTYLYVTYMY